MNIYIYLLSLSLLYIKVGYIYIIYNSIKYYPILIIFSTVF